ncbi:PHP domain-containing protein [Maribellus sediminis]|uniref:PHP domain-containing protein n=1 Tax=Maribellus sediminis TaxID=2696285 RepID=UPI00142FC4A0|nr:PHP domain-containing protein [Maribellus sediminis]
MTDSKSIFTTFPQPEELLAWFKEQATNTIPDINGHVHTPHSFSAFLEVEQPFLLAKSEGVSVLGINDFYTTDGYNEFAEMAEKHKIFPLYNIEFMALQNDLQEAGIRVNDPSNPGRTYFSGKGLRQPAKMSAESAQKIKDLQEESNRQTYQMVEKLNAFLAENDIYLQFDAEELQNRLAKNLFRERHIAQAIRIAVFEKEETDLGRAALFNAIFGGKEVKSAIDDVAGLENEIRNNLLKAGGAAFVPEDPKAFLSLEEVQELIIDAGGIPCYPVLLDFGNENYTDYEEDKEKLLAELKSKNVYSIELIPGRNKFHILKDFVKFFNDNGFVITFGSEHNTPKLDPMKLSAGGGIDLDDELKQINYEGTAVIAAHQYLLANGKEGYLKNGIAKTDEKADFIELGKAVIAKFLAL